MSLYSLHILVFDIWIGLNGTSNNTMPLYYPVPVPAAHFDIKLSELLCFVQYFMLTVTMCCSAPLGQGTH